MTTATKPEREVMLSQLADLFEEQGDSRNRVLRGLLQGWDVVQQAVEDMHSIRHRAGRDAEVDHSDADDALCSALYALGMGDMLEDYEAIEKWYS